MITDDSGTQLLQKQQPKLKPPANQDRREVPKFKVWSKPATATAAKSTATRTLVTRAPFALGVKPVPQAAASEKKYIPIFDAKKVNF